jgi:hypothetical protein
MTMAIDELYCLSAVTTLRMGAGRLLDRNLISTILRFH